jgi:hypothetical protein
VSRAALRLLLQLLRAGRRGSSVEAHATVLRMLGGPALLDLLGQGKPRLIPSRFVS